MNEQLFRKKSIEQVSSPEQLNEYIRVSNPGVWMVLAAIVFLLVGVCVWGFVGHLDTTLTTVAIGENDQIIVYVKESDIASVESGMMVRIDDAEYTVSEIASNPIAVDDTFTDYALHVGELVKGEWVYPVKVNGEFSEGVHNAKIVIDSVSPISFIMN